MKSKISISRLLCFSTALWCGAAAQAKTLSYQETLRFAMEHSPVFDQVRMSKLNGALLEKNAFATMLPSLDFSATGGLQQNHPPVATDPYNSSLSFNLTENLYDNGQSWTQFKISKINDQISDINFLKARDKLILDVSTEYYNLSLNIKLLDVKKEQLTTLEKQLNLVNSQYQQGFKTKKDYLRLKSQAQRAQIDLLNEKNTIENSANEIRRLMGVSPDYSQGEGLDFAPLEPSEKFVDFEARRIPKTQIYDYRAADLQSRINELNVDLVKRQYWPQVSLKLAGFYSNSGIYGNVTTPSLSGAFAPLNTPAGLLNGSEGYGWSALVTLNYNIWDWGIRRRAVEIAENSRVSQDDTIRNLLLSTNNTIRQTELELQTLQQTYKIQKELLTSESQSYDILRADYREGKIAYLDMITSLNNLLDAKVNYYGIYFRLLGSLSRYQFYEGTLYEKVFGQ